MIFLILFDSQLLTLHLFEFWTLTSTQLLEHTRFLCLFPSLYPFLSPSLYADISTRHSDIGCTPSPLLYALETSTPSKGKFTVAIMNALMFQPRNTPKWGHRRTRVVMARNTLITIECTKIIDRYTHANLSSELKETKFKYTYLFFRHFKYFSILLSTKKERERERKKNWC